MNNESRGDFMEAHRAFCTHLFSLTAPKGNLDDYGRPIAAVPSAASGSLSEEGAFSAVSDGAMAGFIGQF